MKRMIMTGLFLIFMIGCGEQLRISAMNAHTLADQQQEAVIFDLYNRSVVALMDYSISRIVNGKEDPAVVIKDMAKSFDQLCYIRVQAEKASGLQDLVTIYLGSRQGFVSTLYTDIKSSAPTTLPAPVTTQP